MEMKLFESILNTLVNESMGEAVINPNDNSKDVFTCKTTVKNDKPVTMVYAELDGEDLKKVAEVDPTLIKKKWAMVTLTPGELNDPNSEGYKKIIHLCDVVSQLGKYGQINPQEVVKEAQFTAGQAITPEKRQELEADEDALWDEFVNKFDDPRIQSLLQSLHTFMPLAGLDHKYSEANLSKILSQDNKRIAAGKEPATYVAPPQYWRNMNRRIKNDAIPFYLYYKKDAGDVSDKYYDAAADQLYGADKDRILGGQTAKQKAGEFGQAGTNKLGYYRALKYKSKQLAGDNSGFGYDVYYDVADTEPISGLDDKWNDPNREGLTDNIRWKPTEASLGRIGSDMNMSSEELESAMGGVDDKYAIEVYNALKKICWSLEDTKAIRSKPIATNADGSAEMESIRRDIFAMIVSFVSKQLEPMYAKPEVRKTKAEMVACMFVGAHRIAPEMALQIFRGLNKEELNAKAEKLNFEYKTIYNKLSANINKEIRVNSVDTQQRQAMEESVNNMGNAMNQFYSEIDSLMANMGISKDGNGDDDLSMSQEEMQLNEAKFYRLFNKINQKRF